MFDNIVSLNSVMLGLEAALRIEMDPNKKTKETVDAAIERLENAYVVTFDQDVFTLTEENQLMSDKLSIFLRDVRQALCGLAFFTELKLFHKNIPITLADTNYLGYARDRLLVALQYLRDVDEYDKHAGDIIESLTISLDNVPMCSVKRLCISLLTLHRLGIYEGVSCIATLLYTGGLVI